ncbi:MAG: sigma-70 family RNA polymerase sigma factor [Candidatus Zixiibacteriota bacterium]
MDEAKELIDDILSGNSRAFEQLVKKYQRLVAHIVYKMIPEKDELEDLCQEVFVKVYQNLEKYRGDAKFSTWIGRITYNRCVDHLNRKQIPVSDDDFENSLTYLPDDKSTPNDNMEKGQVSALIQQEVDSLPPQLGVIVVLYHLQEMSYAEIGKILDMPDGTVKSYLFRGRKLLKERLLSKYNIEEFWQ